MLGVIPSIVLPFIPHSFSLYTQNIPSFLTDGFSILFPVKSVKKKVQCVPLLANLEAFWHFEPKLYVKSKFITLFSRCTVLCKCLEAHCFIFCFQEVRRFPLDFDYFYTKFQSSTWPFSNKLRLLKLITPDLWTAHALKGSYTYHKGDNSNNQFEIHSVIKAQFVPLRLNYARWL